MIKKIFFQFFRLTVILFFVVFIEIIFLFLENKVEIKKDQYDFSNFFSSNWGKEGAIRNEDKERIVKDYQSFEGTPEDIIFLVNQERELRGLQKLSKNDQLMNSALKKALDMKEKNYFDHISPEGIQPWFFAEQVGYKYETMGENLAEGFFSAQSVHQAWMKSEGHRKNILSADFEEIGVAIIDFEENGLTSYIIVEHFGSQFQEDKIQKIVTEKVVCDQEVIKQCKDLEKKDQELENAIEEYKEVIKKAKENRINKEEIRKLEKNLKEIKEIEDSVDKNLDKCKEYLKNCKK